MADGGQDCAVKVAVRLRPFLSRETGQKQAAWISGGGNVHLKVAAQQLYGPDKEEEKVFTFDNCFSSVKPDGARGGVKQVEPVGQQHVYENIGSQLLSSAMDGFNCCLFAYGQTGSGKTYSVMGHERDQGIVPRLTQDLFERGASIEEMRVTGGFLEIYNEQLKDLLNPDLKRRKPLYVHQHPQLGVYVPHLTEAPVSSHEDCMSLIDFGNKIRATSQTNMNSTSSRSHALFILRITFAMSDGDKQRIRSSTLNLIDLAGSERVKKSGAAGMRMREGQNINQSLSVLGQVISKLAKGKTGKEHVPFRQSKLTYLLTDALSGNSRTLMVAAISPAKSEAEETLGTLRFASSVKKIRTVAVQNDQDVQQSDLLLQTMRSEAESLRAAVAAHPQSPNARRLTFKAEAVEKMVLSMKTRIDPTLWGQALRSEAENQGRQRQLALASLSLPFAIGGMLGQEAGEGGVTQDSPYLLNISDDISLAGRLLYFLPEPAPVGVGSAETNRIRLMGLGIPDQLCEISVLAGGKGVEVQYSARGGRLVIDGSVVADRQPRALHHGARIVFGREGQASPEPFEALPGMEAPPLPRGTPAPGEEADLEARLRAMLAKVRPAVDDTECHELLRRAREVENDVEEANDLLREMEGASPSTVVEVGLLLRQGCPLEESGGLAPNPLRLPRMVVHSSRTSDGELLAVWPLERLGSYLEELRDKYQSRCDRQRAGLPIDKHGMTKAWAGEMIAPQPGIETVPEEDALYELSNEDSDDDDDLDD